VKQELKCKVMNHSSIQVIFNGSRITIVRWSELYKASTSIQLMLLLV